MEGSTSKITMLFSLISEKPMPSELNLTASSKGLQVAGLVQLA
jgi:hypothetical protein